MSRNVYKNPGRTQTTNINNHERIKTLLLDGAAIEILALPDTGLLHYGQFHLNLAAALEDDIIRSIDPEWNGGKPERDPGSVTENVEVEPVARSSFTFTLYPTYARTGFFNVGLASSGGLGADGEEIEIFCGASEHLFFGAINRRANPNGTPRIMGGVGLRDWFEKNASVKQEITVAVLSPTTIRLSAVYEG